MIKKIKNLFFCVIIYISAILTISILFLILGYILLNGIKYINISYITDIYDPANNKFGVLPMIINTIYLVLLTLAISTPIGVLSAIYLTQYAKKNLFIKIIKITTEILSGIPSIIYGLFGFMLFVVNMKLDYSILSGSLTLAIMILPIIIRTTEEAINAVPKLYYEGALGLGATKIRAIMTIIIPCAIPGILTSIILSIGRVIGESAALLFTAGLAYKMPVNYAKHIFFSGRTLTIHLYQLAMLGESVNQSLATATILLIIVFILNIITNFIMQCIRKE